MSDKNIKKVKVLVVEDENIIARDIQSKLRRIGYDVPVIIMTGEEAVACSEQLRPDIVLMDIVLKGDMDGIEAANTIKARFDIPIVYLTAYADEGTLKRAVVTEPFGYMLKPFGERELHTNIEITLYRHEAEKRQREDNVKLTRVFEETINALASTVEIRDPYTAGHQRRVAELAVAIAKEINLPVPEIKGIYLASLVHDIGKIKVPAEILNRPSRITEAEFAIIKTHPEEGHNILKDIDFPWPIAQMVLQHHESMDGSGYPHGLAEKEILTGAKIIALADVVEAMTSHRPYREAHKIDATLDEISRKRGKGFCARAVDACLRLFREKGFNFSEIV